MLIRRLARRLGALAGVVLLVSACSAASGTTSDTADGSGGEIQATNWVLRSYDVAGSLTIVPDDLYADADFRAQRVKGFAGCNTYDAVYWANGRQLLVSMAATTLMACPDPAGSFETAYLALLDQSRYFNIRLDTLTIRGADGTILLVFDAAPNNPLLGSWIVDSYASAPNKVTAPLEGTELTAVFRLAKVGGSSGCNTYDGPYYDEWHPGRDRPARHHADGLRR